MMSNQDVQPAGAQPETQNFTDERVPETARSTLRSGRGRPSRDGLEWKIAFAFFA